jgi:hypothetical protein
MGLCSRRKFGAIEHKGKRHLILLAHLLSKPLLTLRVGCVPAQQCASDGASTQDQECIDEIM